MIPLLRASHFQPALSVTVIATVLAVSVGRGAGSIVVALAVAAGQLSVGWSNDYLDRDRDRRTGRVDKPIVAGQIDARTVGTAAIVAALACVPLSFLSGWRAGAVHLGAVAVAWLYNVRLKATVASPVPFALAFGVLPAFVTLGLAGHPWPPAWAVVAAGLLGTAAHFVNTLADLDQDARVGVRGLPHRLGASTSLGAAVVLMAVVSFVLAIAPAGRPSGAVYALLAAAWASAAGVLVAAHGGHPRGAWSLTLCTTVIAVGLFLAHGRSLA